jgi:hypothetical protein
MNKMNGNDFLITINDNDYVNLEWRRSEKEIKQKSTSSIVNEFFMNMIYTIKRKLL